MARGVTVRHGQFVFHVSSVAEAVDLANLSVDKGFAKKVTKHMGAQPDLTNFAEQYKELVHRHVGSVAAARNFLPAEVNTEVRDLLRARGASCHPVPANKCSRVLAEVEQAFQTAKACEGGRLLQPKYKPKHQPRELDNTDNMVDDSSCKLVKLEGEVAKLVDHFKEMDSRICDLVSSLQSIVVVGSQGASARKECAVSLVTGDQDMKTVTKICNEQEAYYEDYNPAHPSIDKAEQTTQTTQADLGMDGILAGVKACISEHIGFITAKHDKDKKYRNLGADLEELEGLLKEQLHNVEMKIDQALA